MNRVLLIGRLTKDPEVRYTQGEKPMAIARYTLAVDRMKKDEADFIGCTAFGAQGEFAEKYLKKGMRIAVEGRIQTGSYEKDGKKTYTTTVVADRHEFVESKKDAPAATQEQSDEFMNIPEGIDELPFN